MYVFNIVLWGGGKRLFFFFASLRKKNLGTGRKAT